MTTQVIIDGAVPRTSRERCNTLLTYLKGIAADTDPVDPNELAQWENDVIAKTDEYEFWNDIEDEIIEAIDERLPDDLIIEMGLHTPGDVIVHRP